MEPNKISVVIVSFRRAAQLRELLQDLRMPDPSDALQVVVVDNGSQDEAAALGDEFPEVRFSRLPQNFGLTRALNIGIRSADREYVLLLHDDVRITAQSVLALAAYLEDHPNAAAVCPFFNAPQVRPLPTPAHPDPPLQTPQPAAGDEISAECVTGAAIMVRAAFLRSMGHIDERYGNYGSEIEICAQVRSSGRKIVVLARVPAQHVAAGSPVPARYLEGDRIAGTSAFLSKHRGMAAGLFYRLKTVLKALITLNFSALAARKIDGWG